MTGKSRRPREDGTRESKQGDQEKTLLFVGRVLGHGWMYKEEERKDGWIPGNLPISPRGGSPSPTMPPPSTSKYYQPHGPNVTSSQVPDNWSTSQSEAVSLNKLVRVNQNSVGQKFSQSGG